MSEDRDGIPAWFYVVCFAIGAVLAFFIMHAARVGDLDLWNTLLQRTSLGRVFAFGVFIGGVCFLGWVVIRALRWLGEQFPSGSSSSESSDGWYEDGSEEEDREYTDILGGLLRIYK